MSLFSGAAARRRASLPLAPSALLGRAVELDVLDRLLTAPDIRLVTLTGPPGVGKTRLAVAAAAAVRVRFADGVVFVDLTSLRDPALVTVEIAGALGLDDGGAGPPAADPFARAWADEQLLLVLDNFEHVLPAGPDLAAILAACPQLRLLVTSRERLHLQAEHELVVAPLELPGRTEVDVHRLAATPSVAMLVERVRVFEPDFAVTPANRAALAEICVRLDGLPLALELAAARLRLFTPGELSFRLRHRIGQLANDARDVPDRHRTLRAAVTWSHDLLDPREKALFRQLSVFVGGWTFEAAQRVGAVPDVIATTASLVDKSLVRRQSERGDTARLVMLESLREFAAELLDHAGETAALGERHAQYFTALAARTEARMGSAEETAAIDGVARDVGNLRAALAYCLAHGRTELALPLASALGWYFYARGQLGNGQATLDAALGAAAGSPEPPDDALAGALLIAGVLALGRGELDRAEDLVARSVELDERVHCPRRLAICTAFLGHLARSRGRQDDAVVHYERAKALYEQLPGTPGVAWSRYDLGLLIGRRGDADRAADLLRESIARFRDLGYPWGIGYATWALATVELRRGRADDAAALLTQALATVELRRGRADDAAALLTQALASFEATEDGRGLAQSLEAVADLAAQRHRYQDTAGLLGAAAVLRDRLAAPLPDEERGRHHALTQRARRELGPEAADLARCAGREMATAEALAFARATITAPPPRPGTVPGPAPQPAGPLTRREHQVALLVRHGRTNRQIGRLLGIAEKTTEVHVHNIIRKLDASSRVEIAAWVATRERGGVPGEPPT